MCLSHAELYRDPERLRTECDYIGIMDLGEPLEIYNCRECHSTISLPGIGPGQWEDDDGGEE